ncbi:hypothetical protein [Parageobacillus thermoglucosidasius]|uniref:Uncharacterized protein n=1 Tax=Parageobacillus thermoglucosidasius TaxID=1426 RepID=A0AB38R3A9_PARTM|nr:hypothetical protein [Parageobacillus thermoglucosidasius]UOE78397.1 hypothetical protein IMI45_20075 [Parageobacillus thermoglucosidasius]
MNFINLTPHTVNVVDDSGNSILSVAPSGAVARVTTQQTVVGNVAGIDIVRTVFGDVDGLSAPQPDTVYIVSTLVLQSLKANGIDRDDVVAPDTSPESVVRDNAGNIIGVRRFQVL